MTGTYKVGVPILVTYQAIKAASDRTIQMDVYDDAQSLSNQSGTMIEITGTGRYCLPFTPDVEGDWIVMMSDSGKGEVVKAFEVCSQDIDTIGGNVDAIKTKTDAIPVDPASAANVVTAHSTTNGLIAVVDTKVNIVDGIADDIKVKTENLPADPASATNVAAVESNIRGGGDTLDSLSDQIDTLESPAMVG